MSRRAAVRAAMPLAVAACLAAAASAAMAQAGRQAVGTDPGATPQPASSVRDPDFGVVARHYGLRRDVEMFQWTPRGDGGYARAWSRDALDSSAFAPGHDNPPFPLRNRQWLAGDVRIDGMPLDPGVLAALGRWVPFRPSFSALPGNLAATFQPEGDGLGTAENPMAPEVGDLRIHWQELRLPPLAGRIELRAGRWVLRAGAKGPAPAPAALAAPAGGDVARSAEADGGDGHRWFAAALLFAAAVSVLLARRRKARRGPGRDDGT